MSLGTIHAEEDALDKLPARTGAGSRRCELVDLVVIRTTPHGALGRSRPCAHCLFRLSRDLPKRGYQLRDVYYSDEEGVVLRERFARMAVEHVSRFYSKASRDRDLALAAAIALTPRCADIL